MKLPCIDLKGKKKKFLKKESEDGGGYTRDKEGPKGGSIVN